MRDLTWLDRIACAGMDPDIFFPERGERAEAAKVVCRTCPVASQCQEFRPRAVVGERFSHGRPTWGPSSA
jgi:hypothetical protein